MRTLCVIAILVFFNLFTGGAFANSQSFHAGDWVLTDYGYAQIAGTAYDIQVSKTYTIIIYKYNGEQKALKKVYKDSPEVNQWQLTQYLPWVEDSIEAANFDSDYKLNSNLCRKAFR